MLTNGPESKIGQILEDIPRPRKRMEVVEHPSYYSLVRYLFQSAETHQETRARKPQPLPVMVWKSQPRNWLCATNSLCTSGCG